MSEPRTIRVGNAGGYWGDDPGALLRQISKGPLDYVTVDFLAEITMSILQKQRARRTELGYATDFLEQLRPCLPLIQENGVRVISNAGGIHPRGCGRALMDLLARARQQLSVAVVEGDDLMDRLDELLGKGLLLRNMETGEPLSSIRERVLSANAYLGAGPVIRALEEGARVVITGRVTDTGITAAAPAFEFGWGGGEWDRLASAVVAAHILECGAQATGGNLTDWEEVPSFLEMGYPIAEFLPDGSFTVTKHPGTGGVVNRKSVTSQLVYEMGDPRSYITPDVIADFSTIQLREEGPDRVRVWGVRGRPPTDQLKVSISYRSGFKAHGTMIVSGPRALERAREMAGMFWKRLELDFEETSTELVGHNACHGHLSPSRDPAEVLLRLGARDPDRGKVETFALYFPSLILNSVPGVAIVGARPRIQEVVAYWPCLIPAGEVSAQVTLLDGEKTFTVPWEAPASGVKQGGPGRAPGPAAEEKPEGNDSDGMLVPLSRLCYARSGDKGDTCNIGVVARSQPIYRWLRHCLTPAKVKDYFGEICKGEVERFEVPNLLALNFLLHESLGGGGTVSLRIDPQGKTLADALLRMQLDVPPHLLAGV